MTTPIRRLCGPHSRSGFAPGSVLTFDPGCSKCWLLQESGGRSGLEPPPVSYADQKRAARGTAEQFHARRAREDRQSAARARRELSYPKPEVGR